jgi:hypothetical protein
MERNLDGLFLLPARPVTLDTRKRGEAPNTIGIAMASQELKELNAGRPAYVRFLLLLLGEAIAGLFLYATFTSVPSAVRTVIGLTVFVIVQIDIIFRPRKNKSLASLLCGITASLSFLCWVAWRITHENENFWLRLGLVGGCLTATLIVLEWRADA